MIRLLEFRHDLCRYCRSGVRAEGVVVEAAGVCDFFCDAHLMAFVRRIRSLPDLAAMMAQMAERQRE